MRMKPFDEKDGYRVWLADDELAALIETMKHRNGTPGEIAGRLGGHCGLRREEASKARPVDVQRDLSKYNLRVWEDAAKAGKYRETPIPTDLAQLLDRMPELRDDQDPDEPVLGVVPKTLNRWVKRAGEQLHAETGNEGWQHVSYHDLRRTWGTRMLEQGTLPAVVLTWGGWNDWVTFRKHYLGEFSPHALRRERNKVSWLGGDPEQARDDVEDDLSPVRTTASNADRY